MDVDVGAQVVDAANILIQDDKRVGTVLLVMAKHGLMEWVPAKQNLRPITLPAGLCITSAIPRHVGLQVCASLLPAKGMLALS